MTPFDAIWFGFNQKVLFPTFSVLLRHDRPPEMPLLRLYGETLRAESVDHYRVCFDGKCLLLDVRGA